ncbi:hypothetical protein [Salipaludibacillus aurantiacus]|uniref:Uncharacterized protein n=1 Tax=Salipaludibacillus aurantiacus TaxID=1601833 RepID=A0A1H9W5F9_9BACI|nr:hypothetical protein [Salipaludibacillus aurantiacus]SES29001.1 hypothetical protein SAMN05518684_11480 [Salipaludibacillus aurantiacus]
MQLVKNIVIIAVISLVLHGIWEFIVCVPFYAMESVSLTSLLMWSAIMGDVVMTLGLYGILVFVNKQVMWFQKFRRSDLIIILFYALFFSFYFEVSALVQDRWIYSDLMPLFPNTNIGLVPVLQLVILFPLTFLIARKFSK